MKKFAIKTAADTLAHTAIALQLRKAMKRMGSAGKTHCFDEVVSSQLRVKISELDLRDHLPNYTFLKLIEQNTHKWLKTTDLLKKQQLLYWLMAAQQIVYLQPLKAFQQFSLDTQVIGWDEKYAYLLHIFYANKSLGKPAAVGMTKVVFVDNAGEKIRPTILFDQAQKTPKIIDSWLASQQEIKAFFG